MDDEALEQLRQKYQHFALARPPTQSPDPLVDMLLTELILYDADVAGAVGRLTRKKSVPSEFRHLLAENVGLRSRIEELKRDATKDAAETCSNALAHLDLIDQMLATARVVDSQLRPQGGGSPR